MVISGKKYTSGGIHNHVWTFFVAVASLILSAFGVITSSLTLLDLPGSNETAHTTLNPLNFERLFLNTSTVDYIFVYEVFVRSLLLFITSAILLYANRTLKHRLYWPFILYCTVFMIVVFVRVILIFGTYIFTTIRDFNKSPRTQHHLEYSSFSAILLIIFCLLCVQVFFNHFVKSGRSVSY
ncbi:hypothetical protein M3Y97_00184900 [Aphelenchoides bicaudatus]|nr:hypothetical protein M3Y97_00184900 [Aphelenchoides bicaudatus]